MLKILKTSKIAQATFKELLLPFMAWILVNIQLKILMFEQKTTADLMDRKMICVLLSNQC